MTELATTAHDDRPKRSNGAKLNGAAPVLVSAHALAAHLCCVPSYIVKLVDQGVIERRDDGRFDQDQCRAKYLTHLRTERRQSPRAAADTDFTAAKAELVRIRIAEKQRQLIPFDEAASHMEQMIGLFLTRLSGFGARCGGRDLATRRAIDKAVLDLRVELAEAATKLANEAGEPPLDADA